MQRVVILGPGGAGKSVLARFIGETTDLPVTHLDILFWRAGWRPAPRAEAVVRLAALAATDHWVLDGNFLDDVATDGRLERADTVVFLDLPVIVCLTRVMLRLLRDRGRDRPDLPAGCHESLDPEGLRWIVTYARHGRPTVLRHLDALGPAVAVHRLRSRRAVARFVAGLAD